MIILKVSQIFKKYILKIILFIFILWAATELFSIIFMPPPYPNNPNVNFVHKTAYFSGSKSFELVTNNYGFRNAENFSFPMSKSSKKRILLIGDSFMLGGPNTKTIDYFLKENVRDFEIFNAGSAGNDINGYYEITKYYLDKINPDYVIVGLFLGNDFAGPVIEQRNSLRYKFIQMGKKILSNAYSFYKRIKVSKVTRRGVEELTPLEVAELKNFVVERAKKIARGRSLGVDKYEKLAREYDYSKLLSKYPELKYAQYADEIANAIVFREFISESILLNNDNAILNYKNDLNKLKELNNFIKSNNKNIKILYLLFPVSFMVDEKYAEFYKDLGYKLPLPDTNYPLRTRLVNDLKSLNYSFIDVHNYIVDDMFYKEDWHFTEIGNKVVADLIYKFIIDSSDKWKQ